MHTELLELLACPTCLTELSLVRRVGSGSEITAGELTCDDCGRAFPIIEGIPVFGAELASLSERQTDIEGEKKYSLDVLNLDDHLAYAAESIAASARVFDKLSKRRAIKNRKRRLTALDLGAGSCGQSWQLARRGYRTVAA